MLRLHDLKPLRSLPAEFAQYREIETVDLTQCERLEDISSLAGLTQLKSMSLSWCRRLQDISPIAGLTQLEYLDLSVCTALTDLSPLVNLTALKFLNLGTCAHARDLTPIASLQQLESLRMLGQERLENLASIAGLKRLTELMLSSCTSLTDISQLTGLSQLQELNLSACRSLNDFTPLAQLPQLQSLILSSNPQLKSLETIAKIPELRELWLFGCENLESLAPLASLPKLAVLCLSFERDLERLSGLANLISLQSLDLHGCKRLTNLEPLACLKQLRSLNLYDCERLQVLTPLAGLSRLESLDLGYCEQVKDLTALRTLTRLKSLDLSGCERIRDITPLAGLTELNSLNLSGCPRIVGLAALAGLTNLKKLRIDSCGRDGDIAPLSALTQLQTLELEGGERVRYLSALAGLNQLKHVQLNGFERLEDLTPLAGFTQLESLFLYHFKRLQNLAPIASLNQLSTLFLTDCERLEDLSPLTPLSRLQVLSISDSHKLIDIEPLAALSGLRSLELSGCTQLESIAPLVPLSELERLCLGGCDRLKTLVRFEAPSQLRELRVSGSEFLEDIRPLAELTRLQILNLDWCDRLEDLTPLAGLSLLRSLDLSHNPNLKNVLPLSTVKGVETLNLSGCKSLRDVAGLEGLAELRSLDLSDCELLESIAPLARLAMLQTLKLRGCARLESLTALSGLCDLRSLDLVNVVALDYSPEAGTLDNWPFLHELIATHIVGPPASLGSKTRNDNALPRIRLWQKDLQQGEAPNSIVKVCVLGNGRVGKTQLCRRLRAEVFDASTPSTHGIALGPLVRVAEAKADRPAIDACLWDFGGQDIYLGTHALFLDDGAIYVIAWNPAYENNEEFSEGGARSRNRPLVYWLEFVRYLAGSGVPVIVVQTQCDREGEQGAPMPADHGFDWLKRVTSSAMDADGMDFLTLALRDAAAQQLRQRGKVRLPSSWLAVRSAVQRRLTERTLTLEAFNELCVECCASADPRGVLEFLHRSGEIFWKQGTFDDRVVIDLDWALQGVYAVLDRDEAIPRLRSQFGSFEPADLRVWDDYSENEQALFLDMMQTCRVCFEVSQNYFIVPDHLPSYESVQELMQGFWQDAKPDVTVVLHYEFLHEGIVREMICAIGKHTTTNAIYWAYGLCFYAVEQKVKIRVLSKLPDSTYNPSSFAGEITIEAAGKNAHTLVKYLADAIVGIGMGTPPSALWTPAIEEAYAEGRQRQPDCQITADVPADIHPTLRELLLQAKELNAGGGHWTFNVYGNLGMSKIDLSQHQTISHSPGAMTSQGHGATQSGNNTSVTTLPDVDLAVLAEELGQLRLELRKHASSLEQDEAVLSIGHAQAAAQSKDARSSFDRLKGIGKSTGKWVLAIAGKIAVGTAVKAIAHATGIEP